MPEARVSPRVSPLIIRAKFQSGEKRQVGYVTNLSATGAFLATEELFPLDHTLRVTLDLPWRLGEIEVEAKVVWRNEEAKAQADNRPIGMGLDFVNLGSEEREKLGKYIERFFELAAQIEQEAL